MDQHWLTVLIVLLIIGIIFDAMRRMRSARRDSIKMALKPTKKNSSKNTVDESGHKETGSGYGSEFPNGGARVSEQKIDPSRINQVRNKYNFGTDMSVWKGKVAEKIAEHTGIHKLSREELAGKKALSDKNAPRIEPSFEHADPLLDTFSDSYSRDDRYQKDIDEEIDIETTEELVEITTEKPISPELTPLDSTSMPSKEISSKPPSEVNKEPVQASLNLEDSVPMLMDSLDEIHSEGSDELSDDVALEMELEVKAVPEKIVTVGTHIEPIISEEERTLVSHSANKPRYESKYTDHARHQVEPPQEVLVIHVRAAENEYFYGSDLLELILDNGLRFGAMDIFHRHAGEDGEGPILFSMANMVKPGVFDLHTFEEFSTVGLSFFLGLPTETDTNMETFDIMLATVKDIAERLEGELKDEDRSVLTKQTIEHYRERIRDFVRRQRLEKNKP
ncbi:MAG: cell division protein ZipA [Cellvibrionaceae bacterium]|jgi:cell division protein ZipA